MKYEVIPTMKKPKWWQFWKKRRYSDDLRCAKIAEEFLRFLDKEIEKNSLKKMKRK